MIFIYRITKNKDVNLFEKDDYELLQPWKNDFLFCECFQQNNQLVDEIQCSPREQLLCTEQSLTKDNTVRCELARKKRSTDRHKSQATRKRKHAEQTVIHLVYIK